MKKSNSSLVSIIINNYNYGRFLEEAINSAINQTYPLVEIIVVDDGSTDHSQAVIAAYENRIKTVFKENGGQASALNTGFACSQGDIIIFLDADDILHPEIAGRVEAAFRTCSDIVRLQYRLELLDALGKPTGAVRPDWNRQLPGGDLRRYVLAFPDDIPWQPTSGNAFSAWVLREIFPLPEEPYRICADYYLSNLTPLFGEVRFLDEIGAGYRVHGENQHHTSELDLNRVRQIIVRTLDTHTYLKECADSRSLYNFPGNPALVRSVTFLANRVISRKLEPDQHPISGDRLLSLTFQGIRAAWGRFDLSWSMRMLYSVWFVAVLLAPRDGVRWLARKFFQLKSRGPLDQLVRVFQRQKLNTSRDI